MREEIRHSLRAVRRDRERLRCGPRGVRAVSARIRVRHVRDRREGMEVDPHGVDPVEMRACRIRVDRYPLLVRLVADGVVARDDVRLAVGGRDPLCRRCRAVWSHRHGDDLGGLHGIGLLRLPDCEVVAAVALVEELVRQVELVVVAEAVEGADGVGVVGPAFVPRHMTLHGPRLAAVERLVEAKEVVVALGAHDPLGRADQMLRIRRIDADVGFGVILHQLRRARGIPRVAAGLCRIGRRFARVLAGRGAGAGGHAAVPVARAVVEPGRVDLGPVAAHLLRRHVDVGHTGLLVARRVRLVRLIALRHVADARTERRRSALRGRCRSEDDSCAGEPCEDGYAAELHVQYLLGR